MKLSAWNCFSMSYCLIPCLRANHYATSTLWMHAVELMCWAHFSASFINVLILYCSISIEYYLSNEKSKLSLKFKFRYRIRTDLVLDCPSSRNYPFSQLIVRTYRWWLAPKTCSTLSLKVNILSCGTLYTGIRV
jgi:hypothetical protein